MKSIQSPAIMRKVARAALSRIAFRPDLLLRASLFRRGPAVALTCLACARPAPVPMPVPVPLPMPVVELPAPAPPRPIPPRLEVAAAAAVGMRAESLDSLDAVIAMHLDSGASPGASLAVGRHGRLVRLRGYGVLDQRLQFGPVDDSTIYDLASLTKVVGTTTAVMMLLDDGLIELDAPVSRYIPEWAGNPVRDAVTVRNLLLHNSGLPAGGPLYRTARGGAAYRMAIAAVDLVYPPGTRTVYSDYGAIMLGAIVEAVSGMRLDRFLHDRLFQPLGMTDTGFNPLQWTPGSTLASASSQTSPDALPQSALLRRIAPTEWDSTFRQRHMQGVVHDENAYAMGGVAGHAGLFSSARDLAVFAQLMLNRGTYGGHRYIAEATVDTFTRRASQASSRALGWDTPTRRASNGDYFTASSFGHTGFTGTSIWIDPERDLFVVLLTNRVNPTRANQKHLALRRDVADRAQLSIADMPVAPRVDPPRPERQR